MSALDPKTLDNTEKSKFVKFRLLRVFILINFIFLIYLFFYEHSKSTIGFCGHM